MKTETFNDLESLCEEIKANHRMREDLLRAEMRINQQCLSICTRLCEGSPEEGEKLFKAVKKGEEHPEKLYAMGALIDLLPHADGLAKSQKKYLKRMEKLAKQLPVWEWCEGVRGFGPLNLAKIVAEAGMLHNYPGPAKLWRRMGLAVINGKSQRRVTGDAALEQGYSPHRRSLMFNVGGPLIKQGEEYREIYLERKEVEREKLPEGSKMHIHLRAQRYMEKRLLRDLWREWKAVA